MQEFQNAGYGMGGQQLAPQGFFGGMFGAPLGGAIGRGIGGLLGNSGLGGQIGQIAGGIGGSLLPFGADPVSQAYAQQAQQAQQQQLMQQLQQMQQQQGQMGQMGQMSPQGWGGNLLSRIAGPAGGAIDSIFNTNLGSTIAGPVGQLARLLPFGADPVAAAYAQQLQQAQQQQQLSPQGWFGNLIGQVGQPLGGAIGGMFGQQGMGSTIGNVAGQLGRLLPFGAEAQGGIVPPHIQQQQLQQQVQQLQQQLIQQQQQYQQQLAQLASQLQQQGQQGQQGQFGPQGWFGNLIGQVGRPLGGAIGGMFGNAGLGSTIGGAAGQLGQMLPFGTDPIAAAYAQQAQLAQQQGMPQYSSQQTLH
ncbi:MAG TPA: hypothetical protein VGD52_04740 [Pseudoduganella sp.]